MVLLISAIWGGEGLLPDLLPRTGGGQSNDWLEDALSLGVIAIVALLMAAARGLAWPGRWRRMGFVSCFLLVLPLLVLRVVQAGASAYARTALLTLVPVFAVVLDPYLSRSGQPRGNLFRRGVAGDSHFSDSEERKDEGPIPGSLLAGLMATAGALLVFPVEMPGTVLSGMCLGLVIVTAGMVGGANCWAYRLLSGGWSGDADAEARSDSVQPGLSMVAVLSGFGALGLFIASAAAPIFGALGWTVHRDLGSMRFGGAWIDLTVRVTLKTCSYALFFWLLSRVRPMRAAARYVFAPVFTILMGSVFLRLWMGEFPRFALRTVLGLAVMSISASYLLVAPEEKPEEGEHGLLGLRD